jgi:hypothetical protein
MNKPFDLISPVRPAFGVVTLPGSLRVLLTIASAVLLLGAGGCSDPNAVRVQLTSQPMPGERATFLEIEAQVSGPLAGLRYKWVSLSGECDPQESDQPKTIFTFAEGVKQDRVSVEIWRGETRVAQSEIGVKFDDARASLETLKPTGVQIQITDIPPVGQGGNNSRSHIAGKIRGHFPPNSLVVIYARCAGFWVIQPIAQSMHTIHTGNTWGSWTHTGVQYAALLVRENYEPLSKLEMLPQTNNVVLASTIVDGVSLTKSSAEVEAPQ